MEWHLSEYNIFSNISPFVVGCFNSFKGSYSEFTPSTILKLYELKDFDIEDNFYKKCIEAGIVVNFNEKELLKTLTITNYEKRNNVHITIAPTLACNFNCPYCFEKHDDNSFMDLETQEKTLEFIKKILSFSKKDKLHIHWFGGEPLLAIDIIENISKDIIKYCEDNKIQYSSSMISNGYLFNQKNVDILNKYKINYIQITLDGLEKVHDLTRHLINGNGTFEKIINNLKEVHYNGVIHIRNNVYNDNKQDCGPLKKLIEIIQKQSKNIITYGSAPVINNPGEERENQVNFLSVEDGIDFELKRNNNIIPKCKTNHCQVSSLYFICIDPNGKLYKCWEDYGFEERSFGNIENWDIANPYNTASKIDILTKYINCAGIFDSECYNCNLLPICAGDCPNKKFFCNLKCAYHPYKFNIDYFVKKIHEIVIKKNE